MSLEEVRIKRFKRFGVWTDQFDYFALECFKNRKNISIYRDFGRNRPINLINGSDETVYREPLQLSRVSWIADGALTWSHVFARYKTPWKRIRRIFIGRLRCILITSNLHHCNSLRSTVEIKMIDELWFRPRVSIDLKWRSTVEIARAIGRHTRNHVASSRSLIAIDRTALIAPCHLRALNILKIDIKLEKSIFNSRKSLEIHKKFRKI